MKQILSDKLSNFFYDCGKLAFGVFVVGVLARKPFVLFDFIFGALFTLTIVIIAVIINYTQEV